MSEKLFEQTFFRNNEIIYSLPEEFKELNTSNGDMIIKSKNENSEENIIVIDTSNITEYRTTSGEIFDQVVLSNPRGTDEILEIVEILMNKDVLLKNNFFREKNSDKSEEKNNLILKEYEKVECYFLKEGSSMAYKNTFFIANFLQKI